MTNRDRTVATWADERIGAMLSAPRMWGSLEAVELQIVLLLELRALVLRPRQELAEPRRVLELYQAYLRERFPKQPSLPLAVLTQELGEQTFTATLAEFHRRLAAATPEENPFQHHELAIRLTFAEGKTPSATAFTSYYEEFRRATRAMMWPADQAGPRPTKPVQQATDFTLDDVRVTPANGAAPSALLL